MKQQKTLLATLCALAITACSSGGGNSNPSVKQPERQTNPIVQTAPNTSAESPQSPTQDNSAKTPSTVSSQTEVKSVAEEKNKATIQQESQNVAPTPALDNAQVEDKKEEKPTSILENNLNKAPEVSPTDKEANQQPPTKSAQPQTLPSPEQPKVEEPQQLPPVVTTKPEENPTASTDNLQAFKTAFSTTPKQSDTNLLGGTIITLANSTATAQAVKNDPAEHLDELIIDDRKIALLTASDKLSGVAVDSLKTFTSKDLVDSSGSLQGAVGSQGKYGEWGQDYTAMRYGVATVNGVSHLFVQGYLTPESSIANGRYPMPKNSVYRYTGNALYGKDSNYQQLASEVIADFNHKKVKVALKDLASQTEKLTFGGEINGNTFAGERNGVQAQGAFFGSQANDVGGVFYQLSGTEQGNNGVFGASNKRVMGGSSAETLKDF